MGYLMRISNEILAGFLNIYDSFAKKEVWMVLGKNPYTNSSTLQS